MPNKWITYVKQYAKMNNMKYNDAMKSAECRSSYKNDLKKGEGIVEDSINTIKAEGKRLIKNKARSLIDDGATLIKDKYIGKGIFGDVLKTVGREVVNLAPVPEVVKSIGKMGVDYGVDKTGLGVKKRRVKKGNGGALFNA